MLPIAGGLFLGWALGANDASNVFGTAVASRIIKFRTAAVLCAAMVMIGAVVQGQRGIATVSSLSSQTDVSIIVCSSAAAITIVLMLIVKFPISAAQAVIGAVSGIGFSTDSINWSGLEKIVLSWIITPVAAMLLAYFVYKLLTIVFTRVAMSMLTRDKMLWGGLVVVGMYGSYALGANNVANAVGIFSGKTGFSDVQLALIGGFAISAGVITMGKRMMFAVGAGIMRLDAFAAFAAVLSMAVMVHVFAFVGVPVSARQAIVGAIIGISLIRGIHSVKLKSLSYIAIGWLVAPLISIILAASGYAIFVR